MKIETAFNLNDTIWFITERKAGHSIVRKINAIVEEDGSITIVYLCNSEGDARVFLRVLQDNAYKTKDKLLKSL